MAETTISSTLKIQTAADSPPPVPVLQIASDLIKRQRMDAPLSVFTGYTNARTYYQRKIRREVENWRFYWAHDPELGFGQWPAESVAWMIQQKRQLTQFNFVQVIVDTIAGGIMQMPFDPVFYPTNDEITSLTEAITKAMFADKEQMDWDPVYLELVKQGLVHEGVIKIVIDRSVDSIGNIALRNCLPGSVMADPFWKTWSGKDCRKCWHESWHTPEELMELMPERAEFIAWKLNSNAKITHEYGEYQGITPFQPKNNDNSWGSLHKLVSQYDVVEEKETCEYAMLDEDIEGVKEVKIPSEIPPEDRPAWLNANHPTWDPMYVYEKPEKVKKCYIRSICPTLSMDIVFQNGLTEIQISRLPFFWWAASRANGESCSIVDNIKDPQMLINYWESLMVNKLQTEGGGGSQFADEKGFANSQEFERYRQNRNDPSEVFKVKPGLLITEGGKLPAVPTAKSNFPQEAYQMINHMVDKIIPHISKVTPSKAGFVEGNQSGKLFEMLKMQSDQQVFTIIYGLRIFWNEVYDAYLMVAADLYSRGRVPRKFSLNKGQESIVLNEEIRDDWGNVVGIRNDVARLKEIRHKVIISDKQSSPTEKVDQLNAIGEFIQKLGSGSPLVTAQLVNLATTLMPVITSDERKIIEMLGQKDVELKVAQADVQIAQATLNKITIQNQTSDLIEAIRKKEQEKAAIAAGQPPPQQPPQGKPPSASINFKDLPPDGQVQLAAQAGIQIQPPQLPPPGGFQPGQSAEQETLPTGSTIQPAPQAPAPTGA